MQAANTTRQLLTAIALVALLSIGSSTASAASGTTNVTITITPAAAELLSGASDTTAEYQAASRLLAGSAAAAHALRASYSADQANQILNQLESHSIVLLPDGLFKVDHNGVTEQPVAHTDSLVTAYAL